MNMKEILSGNIARYRKEKGFTQEELAVRLGITFQAVSKWETGQTLPETAILTELAKILNISMDKLFGYASFNFNNFNRDFSPYEEAYKKDEYFWGIKPSYMCLKILELMPPVKPLKLLDIGCGEGKDAVFFARCGYDVSAFDISDAGLDKLKRLAESSRVYIKSFKADIQDYRLEEKFDVLYSSGVLHYIKPELRDEIMANYKSHVNNNGLTAFHVFVKKPFIPRAADFKEWEFDWWKSGELYTYFHDWLIEDCEEYIFDCNSSGISHKHAANRLYARNLK